jgi:valyl-tRNA synthetase
MNTQWTKMSKSKGNVVLPEEVVRGVYKLEAGYEFRVTLPGR